MQLQHLHIMTILRKEEVGREADAAAVSVSADGRLHCYIDSVLV